MSRSASARLPISWSPTEVTQRADPSGGTITRAMIGDMKSPAGAEHAAAMPPSPDLKQILSSLKPVLNDFLRGATFAGLFHEHPSRRQAFMLDQRRVSPPGLQKFVSGQLQLDIRRLKQLATWWATRIQSPVYRKTWLSLAYGLVLQESGRTVRCQPPASREIQVERMIRAKKPWALTGRGDAGNSVSSWLQRSVACLASPLPSTPSIPLTETQKGL